MSAREVFAKNLRFLLRNHGAAKVARDLDISPQQINNQAAGVSFPSERTLVRLATYFGVAQTDFFDPGFIERHGGSGGAPQLTLADLPMQPADVASGRYDLYFAMAEHPGDALRSLVLVRRWESMVGFRRIVRFHRPGHPDYAFYRSDHEGLAVGAGGRTYLCGINRRAVHEPSLIGLEQAATGLFFTGTALLSSMIGPIFTRAVMLPCHGPSLRGALRRVGVVPLDDPEIPTVVRSHFGASDAPILRAV